MATLSKRRTIPPTLRGSGIPRIAPNDLPRLIKWLYAVDREFLSDALWLRYDRLIRQARQNHKILQKTCDGNLPRPSAVHNEPPPHVPILREAPRCDVKDRLTFLPHDIRMIILEFLLKPLPVPKETKDVVDIDPQGGRYCWQNTYVPPRCRPPHPLNQIAGTSKAWRDLVDAFCGHQLLVLKQQIALGRQDDWVPWRELRTYTSCARMELVVRLSEYCAFCGRETISQSEKWPGLTCCGPCEDPYNLPEEARKRAAERAKRKAMADHVRASPYIPGP